MKKIFINHLIFLLITVPTIISAQKKIVSEGFSSIELVTAERARKALEDLKKKNPQATLYDAKYSIARRSAKMDAVRNIAEYLYGIQFECKSDSFQTGLKTRTDGLIKGATCTYRVLDSGIVVATQVLTVPKEIRKKRAGLKKYRVKGLSNLKTGENI